MHLRIAAALAMSACLHARAETVELRYGEDEGQTLAVHAADARGARPVVVHFGPADAALAALLAQRGYVLVDVALPAEGEAHVHAAEALAHAAATVARYGGDPARLHLVGDGAQAAATARLGADLETLTQRRVPREAIRGMVLRGGRRYPLAVGYLAPPTLLLHGRDDGEARRDAERYAARLREGGASAETMVLPDAAQRGAVQAVAWLDTAAVARVARFEQLAFEHETGLPPALASLAAWSGALHGGAGDAPRLLRKAARGASWALEHDFGARYASVAALVVPATSPALAPPCVVLRAADESLAYACLGARWAAPRALPLAAAPRIVALREPGDAGALLVGSGARIARVARGSSPVLERDGGGPVVALAWCDGHAYAATGGDAPSILRREQGRWRRVASLSAHALSAAPEPGGAGHEVLLVATSAGIARLDPRRAHARTPEIDFAEAFGAALGDGAAPAAVGASFAELPHPQTHDAVHLLPIELSHPDRSLRGAYYLVRQYDASYAYALARDFLAPRERGALARIDAIVASPYPGDAAVWFLGADGGGRAALAHGALSRSSGREAVWWDRSAPGHGLALHPAADGWLAMLYTYDAAGEPVWYLAVGELANGRFTPDSNGLARYRLPTDASAPVRDPERSGSIEVRFGVAADSAGCRGTDRTGAEALALLELELDGRRITACIEPIAYGPRGLPAIDTTGVWQAAGADRRFGIALAPQGYDGNTREAALVYYYDADGEPRWALGSAPVEQGAALVELSSFTGPCLGCEAAPLASRTVGTLSHRMHGFCGQAGGSATVTLEYPGRAGGQLARRNVLLERLTRARCY